MQSIVCLNAPIRKRRAINKSTLPMAKWPIDDTPREKLINKGPGSLTDTELLALILNTGHYEKSAVDLAQEILVKASYNLGELGRLDVNQFKDIKGIGAVKACSIVAAMELSRRKQAGLMLSKTTVRSSHHVALHFKPLLADQVHESFHVLYLNHANQVLKSSCIGIGGINSCSADVRIILREALELYATQILLCHNHPSGNLKPSSADLMLTEKIEKAATTMNIHLLDHIIVSKAGYYSMREEGFLNNK